MPQRPRAHRLRTGRVSEIGRGYLLTCVTDIRAPIFANFSLARATIDELRHCNDTGLCSSLSFVLMPDHLHWLVQLQSATLGELMRSFKSRSGARINRLRNTAGTTVWQRGYHDRAIRDDEDIRAIARYIAGNPLRAGLAQNIGDYPHWDAVWL